MNLNDLSKRLNQYITQYDSCAILTHLNADGDCLGSSIALAAFLDSRGVRTSIIIEESPPAKYAFLNYPERFTVYTGEKIDEKFIISLDTGDIRRLGKRADALENGITFNIDHHKTNTGFATFNYVDEDASSTGEIIYELMSLNSYEPDIESAKALFTAISTDTGGLRYSNTTPRSMRICADLLEMGIDIGEISHMAFDMTPYPKLMLKCVATENMELLCNGRVAVITLEKDDYSFLEGNEEYFDGIVNITVNTEGVIAGALIRENDNGIKVNLRSNTDDVDVSSIASAYGGGGHQRASGCTMENMPFHDAVDAIKSKLCSSVG